MKLSGIFANNFRNFLSFWGFESNVVGRRFYWDLEGSWELLKEFLWRFSRKDKSSGFKSFKDRQPFQISILGAMKIAWEPYNFSQYCLNVKSRATVHVIAYLKDLETCWICTRKSSGHLCCKFDPNYPAPPDKNSLKRQQIQKLSSLSHGSY